MGGAVIASQTKLSHGDDEPQEISQTLPPPSFSRIHLLLKMWKGKNAPVRESVIS